MLPASEGSVRVMGIDVAVDSAAVKRRTGYVPEFHNLYRWMRIDEVIWFCRSFYPTWNDDLCERLMDLFSLQPRKRIRELSKGMLTKVSLLLALAHDPDLLILDEPMSGLDAIVREELLDGVLRAVVDRRCSVLFSSHTLDDITRIADSVAILHQGRLWRHSPIDELLSSARRVRAVLCDGSLPQWYPAATIAQRIDRREWLLTLCPFDPKLISQLQAENRLDAISIEEVTLEELFKDYVKGRKEDP
jgi:ABC-2 type transport system ATP-binding protein